LTVTGGTNIRITKNTSKILQYVCAVKTALIFVHVLTGSTAVRVCTLPDSPAEMQTNRQPVSSVPLSLPWNACHGVGCAQPLTWDQGSPGRSDPSQLSGSCTSV